MESILPHRYSATPVAPILSSIHSQIGQAEVCVSCGLESVLCMLHALLLAKLNELARRGP